MLDAQSGTDSKLIAYQVQLEGTVQGVGMRPAIARLAMSLELSGEVKNSHGGVDLFIQGLPIYVLQFREQLPRHYPTASKVNKVHWEATATRPDLNQFRILEKGNPLFSRIGNEQIVSLVPHDRVVCSECLKELQQTDNRRHFYPFISCTQCGPRYSIIEEMPFERMDTTMSSFSLCTACEREFNDPDNRRYHCHTNACPECGPQVWLVDKDGNRNADGYEAIQTAVKLALQEGKIIGLKGIGGFQLLTRGSDGEAIRRLRKRKHREAKPLAVMVENIEAADQLAILNEMEKSWLQHPSGPILVAQSKKDNGLALDVQCGMNSIGIMLPTSPLHWMLLHSAKQPLVCTSGNFHGQPLLYRDEEIASLLDDLADYCLVHDRAIARPVDDSVIRIVNNQPVVFRLGRGLAPHPLNLRIESSEKILACGAFQKSSLAIANGKQMILGPYIGDLESIETRERYTEQTESLNQLYTFEPDSLVHDLHPDYFSTSFAQRQAETNRIRLDAIQHHHAHVVAGMLEQGWLDRQVLGVAFDGTGMGTDGTIWGGEFLVSTATKFQRVGCLFPIPLVGADLAVREPWRVLLGMGTCLSDKQDEEILDELVQWSVSRMGSAKVRPYIQAVRSDRLVTNTSSVGRLFDGIAALTLDLTASRFEGEPAMLLESTCDQTELGSYSFVFTDHEFPYLDWRSMLRQVIEDKRNGVPPGSIAMRFHRGLSAAIVSFADRFGEMPVVLSGGVFQNRVLVELVAKAFSNSDQELSYGGGVPVNDGGIAAGQLAITISRSRKQTTSSCV